MKEAQSMTTRRALTLAGAFVLATATLIGVRAQAPAQGRGAAAGAQGRGAGAPTATPAPGVLLSGIWSGDPLAVDARGWGWQSQSYVSAGYRRPFWNKAKELLYSGKQVVSYTIDRLDPALYCEVRKHYGFVWFEMQHSTMSWDDVAKMIAACPGPDGAAPMIRMPDQNESSIQKATDIGAIGLTQVNDNRLVGLLCQFKLKLQCTALQCAYVCFLDPVIIQPYLADGYDLMEGRGALVSRMCLGGVVLLAEKSL